jgi:glycosyltransferase involved in cell wall biosynthesis
VVLPAWVEHQPRRLLRALAAGVPVIATPACGLPAQPGLTLVPCGEVVALRNAIAEVMTKAE